MSRSVLRAFTNGTRQLLGVQLIVAVFAVALAGWTLSVTNELVRERTRLRERVIQLEETLASRGVIVPPTAEIVGRAQALSDDAYPPTSEGAQPAAQIAARVTTGAVAQTSTDSAEQRFNPRQLIRELFAPPPPVTMVVLHVRAASDYTMAQRIAGDMASNGNVNVFINTLTPRDPRLSGYVYYDGRQSRVAAAILQMFHDMARRAEIAAWSAQLRGVALPARGEYGADRLDIILPPLPPPPAPEEPAPETEAAATP